MISNQSILNLFSMSVASQETAINTEQTLDQSIVVAAGDFAQIVPMRETNRGEATGSEEPTEFYDNGRTYSMSISPKFCNYNMLAAIQAYCMGAVDTTSLTEGYKHTITPIEGFVDNERSNPTFTAAQRLGGGTQYLRLASGAVQSMSETYKPGEWVKLSASMVFTGKYEKGFTTEVVSSGDNATSITLSATVAGSTAAERLDNVQAVRAEQDGIAKQYYLVPTAVSSASPSEVTIPSLGGAGSTNVNYYVLYRSDSVSWLPLPSAIEEPNIKVSNIFITIGGSWNGTEFQGGRTVCSDLGSIEIKYSNDGLDPKMTPCGTDQDQQYAGLLKRTGRTQTITLSKELRDAVMGELYDGLDTIGLHIVTEGPIIDGMTAQRYGYERVFPKLAIMDSQLGSESALNQETLTLEAMNDGSYGSTISMITNNVSQYIG